jgi:hypothetical protein
MSRQEAPPHDDLAELPKECQKDVLEFLAMSAAPERKGTRASDRVLASVAVAVALSAEARH